MTAPTTTQRLDAIEKVIKYVLENELTPAEKTLVYQWFKIQKRLIRGGTDKPNFECMCGVCDSVACVFDVT